MAERKTKPQRIAAKPKNYPREMMEKAIDVMRQSVPENRADGTPSPLVGAVLVRPDGSIETAARGELREGDHAEYTLLERKCYGEPLDRCVLFTTLEPCLHRNHPKRGCAKHIVNARIGDVYVGVEDDHPAVAGKGIQYLMSHGVSIHMFDRDLQDVILAENKTFIQWAREQLAEPEEEPVKLSEYEDAIASVALEDLSGEALEQYRSKADIVPQVGSEGFVRLLQQQGLMVREGAAATPTGFGLLLFGKQPRNAIHQAGLLARAELPDGKSTRREFGEAMVLIPGLLEEWLNTVLPSTIDRSRMERKEYLDLPFEMIREAVVNGLIHRDYSIEGQKCQLILNADTITVRSPGGPIPPVTLEEIQSFTAPMKSRNPVLHYVFARMGLAEEQGFGLQLSLKRRAEELGLPLPTFVMEGGYLRLTIYRSRAAATAVLGDELLSQLSNKQKDGWTWLAERAEATQAEYARAMGITARTAQRHLGSFVELGLLRKTGAGPSTSYRVR